MHLVFKTHGTMERLNKMQKHFLQHYLTIIEMIELPSMLTIRTKRKYLDDLILDSDDDYDNTEDEATKTPSFRTITKNIRAYSAYPIIVYTVTDGKIKTPLHVMAGQSVYPSCFRRSTIISLNKIGVSVSYDDVPRDRALLGAFAIKKSQDNLAAIPSHFPTRPRAGFVPGAFGNINMKDSSLFSGTETTDYCVFAFFIVLMMIHLFKSLT